MSILMLWRYLRKILRAISLGNIFVPSRSTPDSFSIEPRDVTLEVFNIKGQRVKTLINEHKETGSHNIVWNGTDQNGRFVSSGVYFYRLSTGTNSLINRMLLMK